MQVDIVEFKARCSDAEGTLERMRALGAQHQGRDHQVDTCFACGTGRLKLRQGDIETTLVHYERGDRSGPKDSRVTLHAPSDGPSLLAVLRAALDALVVVDKHRDISWAGNVKLHVDRVAGLGSFLEVEAIDRHGAFGRDGLREQCRYWLAELGVEEADLVSHSYSDLLLESGE